MQTSSLKGAFGAIKGFLPQRTLSKIKVLGSDPEELRSNFSKEGVTPSCLPNWLEGTKDTPDTPLEPPHHEN
jgi:hypothetical protein